MIDRFFHHNHFEERRQQKDGIAGPVTINGEVFDAYIITPHHLEGIDLIQEFRDNPKLMALIVILCNTKLGRIDAKLIQRDTNEQDIQHYFTITPLDSHTDGFTKSTDQQTHGITFRDPRVVFDNHEFLGEQNLLPIAVIRVASSASKRQSEQAASLPANRSETENKGLIPIDRALQDVLQRDNVMKAFIGAVMQQLQVTPTAEKLIEKIILQGGDQIASITGLKMLLNAAAITVGSLTGGPLVGILSGVTVDLGQELLLNKVEKIKNELINRFAEMQRYNEMTLQEKLAYRTSRLAIAISDRLFYQDRYPEGITVEVALARFEPEHAFGVLQALFNEGQYSYATQIAIALLPSEKHRDYIENMLRIFFIKGNFDYAKNLADYFVQYKPAIVKDIISNLPIISPSNIYLFTTKTAEATAYIDANYIGKITTRAFNEGSYRYVIAMCKGIVSHNPEYVADIMYKFYEIGSRTEAIHIAQILGTNNPQFIKKFMNRTYSDGRYWYVVNLVPILLSYDRDFIKIYSDSFLAHGHYVEYKAIQNMLNFSEIQQAPEVELEKKAGEIDESTKQTMLVRIHAIIADINYYGKNTEYWNRLSEVLKDIVTITTMAIPAHHDFGREVMEKLFSIKSAYFPVIAPYISQVAVIMSSFEPYHAEWAMQEMIQRHQEQEAISILISLLKNIRQNQ